MTPAAPPRRRITYFLEAPLRRGGRVLAAVALASLTGAVVARLLPPHHRAAALVRGEWDASHEARLQRAGLDLASRRWTAVRQRAADTALLVRALGGARPYGDADGSGSLAAQVERLRSDLSVRPLASTSFLIEFVHADPAVSARVPNELARLLVEESEAASKAVSQLEARLHEAQRALAEKAAAVARPLPQALSPRGGDDEGSALETDVLTESRAIAASLAAVQARAARLRETLRAASAGGPPSPEAQLAELNDELARLRERYTDEHPDVKALRQRIQNLETTIAEAASRAPSPQTELREAEAEIERLLARQAQLETRASQAVKPPGASPPRPDHARERVVAEHARAQQAYQALLAEWQAAQGETTDPRGAVLRFELLRPAEVRPESPRPWLFALGGALVGLLAGLAAALVAEARDHSVKGPEDLEDILPVPLLTTLPEVRGRARRE